MKICQHTVEDVTNDLKTLFSYQKPLLGGLLLASNAFKKQRFLPIHNLASITFLMRIKNMSSLQ